MDSGQTDSGQTDGVQTDAVLRPQEALRETVVVVLRHLFSELQVLLLALPTLLMTKREFKGTSISETTYRQRARS